MLQPKSKSCLLAEFSLLWEKSVPAKVYNWLTEAHTQYEECYNLNLEHTQKPMSWRLGHGPAVLLGGGGAFKRWGLGHWRHALGGDIGTWGHPLPPLLSLFASQLPWGEQHPPLCPPVMRNCFPQAQSNKAKQWCTEPLKPWVKINLSSFKLIIRNFVTVTERWSRGWQLYLKSINLILITSKKIPSWRHPD
jgi:hypothetical protein